MAVDLVGLRDEALPCALPRRRAEDVPAPPKLEVPVVLALRRGAGQARSVPLRRGGRL